MKTLSDVLVCPVTGEPLRFSGAGGWSSSRAQYPSVHGMPWIYRDPAGALAHWRKKLNDVALYSGQQIDSISGSAPHPGLLASTRARLDALKRGHERNIECLREVFKDGVLLEAPA